MSIPKPPVIKRPIKVLTNGSQRIVYRNIKNIHRLKNHQVLGTATIKKQSYMVREQGSYWIVL